MTNEKESQLLQETRDYPDGAGVYADWLEENGIKSITRDLIRAAMAGDKDNFRKICNMYGYRILEQQLGEEVAHWARIHFVFPNTENGIVDHISGHTSDFVKYAEKLSKTGITSIGLRDASKLADLMKTDFIQQIKSLSIEGRYSRLTDEALQNLAGLSSLKELSLVDTRITGVGLQYLAGMTSLRNLNLSGTQIKDAGLRHLAGLSSLKELSLVDTRITDAGVASLRTALPNCEIMY